MSDETIIKQLKEALENKEYYKWNMTSINNLAMIIENNSEECKKLAMILLKEYIEYCNNRW
jgi:hypothetical protein